MDGVIMTVETKVQALYPTYRIIAKPVASQMKRHQMWVSCPRCIGGSMYLESNREHVCMQCGYHFYHGSTTRKPAVEIPADNKKIIEVSSRLAISINQVG
jgi:acetyl-CoA carboxylase beta subunit